MMAEAINMQEDEFSLARKRLKSQAAEERERRLQAIKRQQARSAGGLGSGTFVKLQEKAQSDIAKQEQSGVEGIEVAEAREKRRRQEVKEQREFQTGLQERGIEAQSAAQEKQNIFSREMTEKQKINQIELMGIDKATKQELMATQNEFQKGMFDEQMKLQFDQLDLNKSQLDEDKRVNDANIAYLQHQQGKPTDLFGSLFGSSFSMEGLAGSITEPGNTPIIARFKEYLDKIFGAGGGGIGGGMPSIPGISGSSSPFSAISAPIQNITGGGGGGGFPSRPKLF